MNLKENFEQAVAKPVSRRQFLGQVGAVALTLMGVSAIIKGLGMEQDQGQRQVNSYGSGAYGGRD